MTVIELCWTIRLFVVCWLLSYLVKYDRMRIFSLKLN